jgi:hypothetical protein
MAKNVGSVDQAVRTAAGAVAGTLSIATLIGAVTLPTLLSPVLGIVAIVMLATAVVGTCPMYSLLGIDTCPRSSGS